MVKVEILDKDDHVSHKEGHVILNTCNRTEIYSGDGDINKDIIKHLFKVTTGLDSSLIGEKAIQGQVREAYKIAAESGISSSLHKLFQRALYVGKLVRTKTGINRGAVSHSQATVDLLLNSGLDLENSSITLIGVNYLNENIIYHLLKKGAKTINLGNRTYYKAQKMSKKYNSIAFELESLGEILKKTDILITATSSSNSIVKKQDFPLDKKMTIIDLAVPPDIDNGIQELINVNYINNEGIEQTVNLNLKKRHIELKEALQIVEKEVESFIIKLENDKKRTCEKIKGCI